MNKIYNFIVVYFLLVVISGCNNAELTTTEIKSTETTTTEVSLNIEVELEYTGVETRGLISIYRLDVIKTSTKVTVSGYVELVKIAEANVELTAEFYDSTGMLIGSSERVFLLRGALMIVGKEFEMNYIGDNLSQINSCILIVHAYE